ncbi:phage capsid family protein [Aliarcobacter cibarius]|uniref:DUF4043 family protein n=1 Tax=Aliarcobacter cibarius TaxID=255507 RepID=A0ABY2V4Q7_9BACT|nr:DUF4043 family protein [Aliarcobacter cibarius]TLS99937.1 DUF4043 family protein [Aliarcobacter cibarius]TLT00346.1 DUF4043 family protein [Aliarcobacter cibarius]
MATWAETDPHVRQSYGREITKISTDMNWWNKFINNSETAIIMTDLRAEKPEGGTVRIYFRDDITGDGVFGNQNFDENGGKQNSLYQDVDYELFGQSVISKNKKIESKMAAENFRQKTRIDLPKWISTRTDKIITAKLTAGATNILACSAATGAYAENVTTSIKAGDVLSVQAIREMKKRAKNGIDGAGNTHPEIEPAFKKAITREGDIPDYVDYYVLIVGQYGANQLKNDPEWVEAQKLAATRGNTNALFSGALGEIDGVIVFERNNWNAKRSGIMTSDIKEFKVTSNGNTVVYASGIDSYAGAAGIKTEIALFLGASAGLLAMDEGFDYYEEDKDAARKLQVAIDRGLGFAKAHFVGKTTEEQASEYHNKDFGSAVIVYSAE